MQSGTFTILITSLTKNNLPLCLISSLLHEFLKSNYFAKQFKSKTSASKLQCPTWADFQTRFHERTRYAEDQRESCVVLVQ